MAWQYQLANENGVAAENNSSAILSASESGAVAAQWLMAA